MARLYKLGWLGPVARATDKVPENEEDSDEENAEDNEDDSAEEKADDKTMVPMTSS